MTTPLTPEERTQQVLESIRTHINNTLTGYVEDIELKHAQVDSIKSTIDSYLEEFEGQAQAIKDGTDALAVEVQRVDEFSDRIDSKANVSHTHVSTDIVDSISTLTLGQGNKVVRTDESGAVLQEFAPTLPSHLTPKTYVDTELSKKANSVHSHTVEDISGLQSTLDSKVDSGDVAATADSTTYGRIPRREADSNNILVGGAPTLPNHATSKSYVDTEVGKKANTTHTHTQSEITDLPTTNTSAVAGTLVVRDSGGRVSVSSPTTADHAATKEYVDTEAGKKANSTHTHTVAQVSGLQSLLDGKAPTTHTHTKSQITDLETISTGATVNHVVKRTTSGNITVPTTPNANSSATSKSYVDGQMGTKVTGSSSSMELWSGTQTQYDALPSATKTRAGFVAVIY